MPTYEHLLTTIDALYKAGVKFLQRKVFRKKVE